MSNRFLKVDYDLLNDKNLNGNQLRVYMILMSLHNENKGYSYPSQDFISKETGISRRSVISIIQHLETIGYIEIKKIDGKEFKSNVYICKHIMKQEQEVETSKIRNADEVKRERIEQHKNIRFIRKYMDDIDSNEAIREMCTSFSYEMVTKGYNKYKYKVEQGKWQVNCSSNLFRDIIQCYYDEKRNIPYKAFNFYKKYMDIYAVQPGLQKEKNFEIKACS